MKTKQITAKEAKQIIGNILEYQFVMMGVKELNELKLSKIDMSQYSLQDLLNANKKIELCNKKARIAQAFYTKKNGTSKGIFVHMTCADRLIAAVYTCLNFEPNGELVAIYGNLGVGVVHPKFN